ncbi:MAG: restriction endonuclease subunit S [Planctomycetota bacterium]|nr:restriction endonuclease subunit S [Planctomycetota bacterium]
MPTLSVTLNRGLINRDDMDRKTDTNLDADEHLLVREGDIAYNMMRMWQGAFGRSSCEGIVSPAYVVIRPLASADSGYFEYAFRRARSIYLFWAYSYGLTNDRLRLYAPDFLRIPFSAPTLPEQRKIANFFTAVDGRIQQLSQKKALLQDYKKGVMQQLFTQALRFKDDHGNEFPDWDVAPLGAIAHIKLGKMLDRAKQTTGHLLPYLNNISLRWNEVDTSNLPQMYFHDDELDRFGLRAGDVVVCEGGEPGRSAVWDGRLPDLKFQKAIHRVRFKVPFEPRVLVLYLENIAGTTQFEMLFTGGGIKHLTRETFALLKVPMISLAEQTKIANFLTALDRKIESVAHQITHTQTFKKGLLQQMFV